MLFVVVILLKLSTVALLSPVLVFLIALLRGRLNLHLFLLLKVEAQLNHLLLLVASILVVLQPLILWLVQID